MIRVALADRELLTAQAIARAIDAQEDMRVVRILQPADPLWTTDAARAFDVLVLDPVGLSELGFGLIRRLRMMHPHLGILVVTGSKRPYHVVHALREGAGGYVRKTDSIDDVLAAVRAVHSGVAVLSREEMNRLLESHGRPSRAGPSLTPRQQQCLNGIVQGMTNQEIAVRLSLSEKTVKNYLRGLFAALGVQDRTGAAVLAIRLGLVSEETLTGLEDLRIVS